MAIGKRCHSHSSNGSPCKGCPCRLPPLTSPRAPPFCGDPDSQVLQLLGEGLGLYNGAEQFEPAVKQLILENPTVAPGSFAVQLGQGTWQVR